MFLIVSNQCHAQLPRTVLEMGSLILEKSTFEDVRAVFGSADIMGLGDPGNAISPVAMCYKYKRGKQHSFVVFNSSDMGGGETILEYRLTSTHPKIKCFHTNVNINNLKTNNGLKLGMSRKSFKKLMNNILLNENGNFIKYEEEINIPASKMFPYESWALIEIKAEFNDEKLVSLRVSKLTSS
jgi:hypothetical protein